MAHEINPAGPLEPFYPYEDKSMMVVGLNVALIVVSTLLVVSRFYVRIAVTKNLGPDDWCAFFALVVANVQSGMDMHMAANGGGKHLMYVSDEMRAKFFVTLPTAQLLFYTGSFATRMAILLFLRRLLHSYKYLWPPIIALTCYFIAFFLAFLLQCNPVRALWDRPIAISCLSGKSEAAIMYTHSGVGIGIDFALFVAPLAILWQRLMFRKMKFRMLAIFSVGAFAVAAGITRLSIITTIDMTQDTTWNVAPAAVWTNLEVHAGLIVSCFPAIHPLFRLLRKVVTGESTTKETGQGYIDSGDYMKNQRSGTGEMYTMKTKVKHTVAESDSQENIVEMGMGIYKSTDVEVRVDDRSERHIPTTASSSRESHIPPGSAA